VNRIRSRCSITWRCAQLIRTDTSCQGIKLYFRRRIVIVGRYYYSNATNRIRHIYCLMFFVILTHDYSIGIYHQLHNKRMFEKIRKKMIYIKVDTYAIIHIIHSCVRIRHKPCYYIMSYL